MNNNTLMTLENESEFFAGQEAIRKIGKSKHRMTNKSDKKASYEFRKNRKNRRNFFVEEE